MDKLIVVLEALRGITDHRDIIYLIEVLAVIEKMQGKGRMKGIPGGFDEYSSPQADYAAELMQKVPMLYLKVIRITLDLLLTAYEPIVRSPRAKTESPGRVELKSFKRKYAEIDLKTKLPMLDENGNEILITFIYTYAYIRMHSTRGDADRARSKILSIYADRGMGKGGTGGYIAAALADGRLTEAEILEAWHANRQPDEPITQMSQHYYDFITTWAEPPAPAQLPLALDPVD